MVPVLGQNYQMCAGQISFAVQIIQLISCSSDHNSSLLIVQIFDGHNGTAAAVFSKDHLLNHVLSAIPRGLGRDEWLHALPRALVAGFVKTDKEFQRKGRKFVLYASLLFSYIF